MQREASRSVATSRLRLPVSVTRRHLRRRRHLSPTSRRAGNRGAVVSVSAVIYWCVHACVWSAGLPRPFDCAILSPYPRSSSFSSGSTGCVITGFCLLAFTADRTIRQLHIRFAFQSSVPFAARAQRRCPIKRPSAIGTSNAPPPPAIVCPSRSARRSAQQQQQRRRRRRRRRRHRRSRSPEVGRSCDARVRRLRYREHCRFGSRKFTHFHLLARWHRHRRRFGVRHRL
jgi:hypothetical protein